MNLGKGFLFPQEEGDPWIPVTPQKPVTWGSNPSTVELQGNQTGTNFPEVPGSSRPNATGTQGNQTDSINWQELLGIYSDLLQQTTTSDFQSSPVVQLNRSIHPTNKLLPHSPIPIENHCAEHQSAGTMLLGQSANTMLLQQNQTLSPNQATRSCNQSCHNWNSPPRKEVPEAYTTDCFQIAPVTPDQGKQLKNDQFSAGHDFSADDSLNQEKDKQEITSTDRQEVRNHCDQLLQSVIASSPPSNTTSLKEKNICADGCYEGIDLNKTPQLKPCKRKKHRPKVVVEGKPKRTPKSTPSKTQNRTPIGKRKYVRKNGLRDSASQQDNETKLVEASTVQSAVKSCGRALNFEKEAQMQEENQVTTPSIRLNILSVIPAAKEEQQQIYAAETQESGSIHNLIEASTVQSAVKSCRRVLNFENKAQMQERNQETTPSMGLNRLSVIPAAKEEQQKTYGAETQESGSIHNLINSRNQKPGQTFPPFSAIAPPTTARDHTLNVIARSINLKNAMAYQTKNQIGYSQVHQQIHGEAMGQMPLQPNPAWAQQLMLETRIGSVNRVAEANENRGYKRDYCNISELTHSPRVNQMLLQFNAKPMNDSRKSRIGNSETHKKRQFEDEFHEAASSMASCTTKVKHSSSQVELIGSNGDHLSSSPCNNGRLPYSNREIKNSTRKQTSGDNGIANCQYKDPIAVGTKFQEQRYLSDMKLQRNCMAGQFFQQYTESCNPSLIIGTTNQNMLSPPQRVSITTQADETKTPEVHKAAKRLMAGPELSILALNQERVLPKDKKKERGYLPFSRKAGGASQNEKQEHATKMEEIICQLKGMQISNNGHAAIREEQTALVPYKGDRSIAPYEGFDPIRRRKPRPKVDIDPETNQLWNLLMGKPGGESTETMDKDKEKWWEDERKVFRGRVDSFIARMHLVQGDRQFSRWKGSVADSIIGVFLTQNVSDHLSSSAFMCLAAEFALPRTLNLARAWEEPEVQIIDPDGTITYHGRKLGQPLYKCNPRASSESSEQRSDHLITEPGIHLVEENNRTTDEEVFSSQNSSESLILQANGDVQSSSDSEVEDQVILCNANKSQSPKNILQTERAASLQQHQCHGKRSPLLDNSPIPEYQKQPSPVCIMQNSASNTGNDVYGYQINSNILQLQGSSAQRQTGHMHPSSEPSGTESIKIPNLRKRKLDEKTKSFDWDTLRKQVLHKGGKQTKGNDRMDSLNYEALRHADVNKISETIKERGMNNMLAARIKDFLNRLVRDHGSIDLEWLRDVPPLIA